MAQLNQQDPIHLKITQYVNGYIKYFEEKGIFPKNKFVLTQVIANPMSNSYSIFISNGHSIITKSMTYAHINDLLFKVQICMDNIIHEFKTNSGDQLTHKQMFNKEFLLKYSHINLMPENIATMLFDAFEMYIDTAVKSKKEIK